MSQTGIKSEDRYVLVYTLDVSLVHIKGEDVKILATSCDSHCGGTDIDNLILQKQIEEVRKRTGIDLSSTDDESLSRYKERLLYECEEVKKRLSSCLSNYEINILSFINGEPYCSNVSKFIVNCFFEQMKDKLIEPIRNVLEQSEL